MLSNRRLLGYLLKGVCQEFSNLDISEIIPCIDSNIHIGDVPLHTQNLYTTERITGSSDADKDPKEGNIFYDLKFSAHLPSDDITLIINVESQKNFNPGYPIYNRALYYVSRLISSQRGTIFHNDDYGRLQKVISIWIFPNPPQYLKNSIHLIKPSDYLIYGNTPLNPEIYQKPCIVFLFLGGEIEEIKNNHLLLLFSLVYSQIHNKNKINITYEDFFHQLTTQYGFLPDDDIFREVHKMSGLEQMIIQDARKEGIEQGIKQGIEQGIEQGKEKGIDLTLNTIGLLIEKLTLANDEENLKRLPFLFKDRQEIQKLFNQYNISLA